MSSTINLADLPVGALAHIVCVDAPAAVADRLADLGFLPGTSVRTLRRAPLGDPRVYELRGTRLCLRRREAARVQVLPCPAGAEASQPAAGAPDSAEPGVA